MIILGNMYYNQITNQLRALPDPHLTYNSCLMGNISTGPVWAPVEKISRVDNKIKLISSNKYLKIINL